MQGAALKLTALAASLAVGFVVLVQVQQNLEKPPLAQSPAEELPPGSETGLDNAPLVSLEPENSSLGESAADEYEQAFLEAQARIASRAKQETASVDQPENPSAQEPVQESAPAQADPFGNAQAQLTVPAQQFQRDKKTPEAAPDPFAQFTQQLNEKVDQKQADLLQKSEQVKENVEHVLAQVDGNKEQLKGQLQQWENDLVQVGHETQKTVQATLNQVPREASPVVQAVADSVQQMIVPVAGKKPASDAPAPLMLPEEEPKPLSAKTPEPKSPTSGAFSPFSGEPTPAPAQAPTGFPAPAGFPAQADDVEMTGNADSARPQINPAPAFGFPAPEEQPAPQAAPVGFPAAETELPQINSQPAFGGFPQMEPEKTAEASENSGPAINPGFPAAVPAVPEMALEQPPLELSQERKKTPASPPAAFFEATPDQEAAKTDEPYRLVPQFNTATPDKMESREPAPFQFSDSTPEPPLSETPAEKPAPESEPVENSASPFDMSAPAAPPSAPVKKNPFAEAEDEPEADQAATDSAKPAESMSGFPDSGFPSSKPVPSTESEPASDSAFPGFPAAPAMEETTRQPVMRAEPEKPETDDSASPAQLPEEPATGFPATSAPPQEMKPETSGPDKVAIPQKAKSTEVDQELIGSAQVDDMQTESMQQPKIELYKSAPENAVLGQPLVYSIEVVNMGEVAVKEVVVEDQFPAGTKLTGTIPRAELVEKTLVWKFPELKPAERKKILVRVVPIESGNIGSISTVSYKSMVTAQTLVTAPKLELTVKARQTEIALGEVVELDFVVANAGQGEARDVILRNLIPAGLEHPAGGDLEYEIGSLKSGEHKEITLALTGREVGQFFNEASIKATGGFSAEARTGVTVISSVMTLTQNAPTRRFVGHAAKFETELRNNTQRVLTNVTVVKQLPNGLEFQAASEGGRYSENPQPTITWNYSKVQPGQSLSQTATLVPRSIGTREVLIQAQDSAGHRAEVSSKMKVEGFASLAVRVPEERGPVAQGERISLRFKVVNRGSAQAQRVVVSCQVPEQLEYLSANGPAKAQYTGQTVQFQPIASLAPDQELTFDLVFNATASGDARVEFEVMSDQTKTPLRHQEQVIIYGE